MPARPPLPCGRPEFTEKLFVFSSVYSLDDVLCLLVYLYSVAGQSLLELEDEESQLQVENQRPMATVAHLLNSGTDKKGIWW